MLKIIYYLDLKTGKSPVKEKISEIKKKSIQTKIVSFIDFVAISNGHANSIITKNIRGYHFSEIRIKFSKNLYRILYFIWQDNKMVLLHMFIKKEGEKTPEKELIKAEKNYIDFMNNYKIHCID